MTLNSVKSLLSDRVDRVDVVVGPLNSFSKTGVGLGIAVFRRHHRYYPNYDGDDDEVIVKCPCFHHPQPLSS